MKRRLVLASALALWSANAFAVNPDELLRDPAQEARARTISSELRCMVCQNQSIDESNAELARDLRLLVRERIVAGDTDQEVFDYLVSRYGEFVLLKPRLNQNTVLLWTAPLLLTGCAILAVVMGLRRRKSVEAPLTEDEGSRLENLLRSNSREI